MVQLSKYHLLGQLYRCFEVLPLLCMISHISLSLFLASLFYAIDVFIYSSTSVRFFKCLCHYTTFLYQIGSSFLLKKNILLKTFLDNAEIFTL